MTISELGSIGEFVSAFAVLVTLIYLSVQVRQAKREAAIAQAQLRQDSGRAMLMHLTEPGLSSLIAETNSKSGHTHEFQVSIERELGLDPEEAHRLSQWCFVVLRYFETYFSLETAPTERLRNNVKVNLQQPFFRLFWRDAHDFFKPEMVVLIDEIIREIEEEAPTPAAALREGSP